MTKGVKLPKKIKVGAHTYDVVFPHNFREVDGYMGLHDPLARRILIADCDFGGSKRKDADVLKTFIHEIIHAVDNVYLKDRLNDEDDYERIVDSLAEGLTQVLLDAKLLKVPTQRKGSK